MRFQPLPIPEDVWLQAQRDYEDRPDIRVKDIALRIGASEGTLRNYAIEHGWTPRRGRRWANVPSGDSPSLAPPPVVDLQQAADALARAAFERINAILAGQAKGRFQNHDRIARTLASLAGTLKIAQQFKEAGGSIGHDDDHESDPRTLDELRAELARHLDRIVAEERAAAGDGVVLEAGVP